MSIQSKVPSQQYKDGWERIFGKKAKQSKSKLKRIAAQRVRDTFEIPTIEVSER